MHRIDLGATFKHAKEFMKEKSWNPDAAEDDSLNWLDGHMYRRLDREAWDNIASAKAKL